MRNDHMLPILAEATFHTLAKARGEQVANRADACRFEARLRREGVGRVPHNTLRLWYRDHGMSHGRIMTPADFRAQA